MGTGKKLVGDMNKENNQNHRNNGNSRDYLAIGVFVAVLIIFIVSAVYLLQTTKKETTDNPLKIVFRWIDDHWQEGKRLLEGKKATWSRNKREREVSKHFKTGRSLYRRRMYRKALQEFDKVIEIDPNNYRAYFWRGRLYLKTNRYNKAITDFKMVIKLKSDYAEAYNNLGWLYVQLEEYDESIKYLSKSLELQPNDGWTYYTRGRCYFRKGDLRKALKDTKTSCSLGYKKGCEVYKKYKDEISRSDRDTISNTIN